MTYFLASYLVFFEGSVAAVMITLALYHRPRKVVLTFAIGAALVLCISVILALIGSSVYFTVPANFYGPIGPDTPNSFPSHHALLAASIVALVLLVQRLWAIPYGAVTLLIEWALVAGRHHHLVDVLGSDLFVAAGAVVALILTPSIVRWFDLAPGILALPLGKPPAEDEDVIRAIESLRDALLETAARQEIRDHATIEEIRKLRDAIEHGEALRRV